MNDLARHESAPWTSNADAASIARWLAPMQRVVVVTHQKPDGDALGSTLAVARSLNIAAGGRAAGFSGVASRAEVWYAGPMPHWAGAVINDSKCRVLDHDRPPAGYEPDAVVVLDTGAWTQLEPYQRAPSDGWIGSIAARAAVIDHHLRGDGDVAHRRWIDPTAAAACQLAADLCARLLGVPSPAKLPAEVAEPLYLGLATDTGWFRHSNVSPSVLRLAADLVEAGARHDYLYEVVEQRERVGRLRLLARALDSLELFEDDTVALLTIRKKDIEAAKAAPGETGGFLDLVKTVESIRVAALLTEVGEGDKTITKVSFRSKSAGGGAGMVDVNKVAQILGGGGHAQAAGARLTMGAVEARKKVLDALGAKRL